MSKRVLDIGNCVPDHQSITTMIESNFDATVDQANAFEDAETLLKKNAYDLVVVNRLLDMDGSSGMEVIRRVREHNGDLTVMLITNFPKHQETAIKIGAVPGFGKNAVGNQETIDLLHQYLS